MGKDATGFDGGVKISLSGQHFNAWHLQDKYITRVSHLPTPGIYFLFFPHTVFYILYVCYYRTCSMMNTIFHADNFR